MKLTDKIAAAYFGADVLFQGVEYDNMVIGVGGYSLCSKDNTIHMKWDGIGNSAKLLLTPLSKVSDEDADYIGDLLLPFGAFGEMAEGEYGKDFVNGKILRSMRDSMPILDYLRSKGYDCGHGSIPSLIAAGVAVEKSEI